MRTTTVFVAVFAYVLCTPVYFLKAHSETPINTIVRFNNDNWDTIPHPKVASFTVHEDGSAEGLTVTNVPFKQYTIFDKDGVRAQRFEIQDHYHYIVQGEIAYSEEELALLLAQYTKTQTERI